MVWSSLPTKVGVSIMTVFGESRCLFIKTSIALAVAASLMESMGLAESDGDAGPLFAYAS
jgi:hypothetical protein